MAIDGHYSGRRPLSPSSHYKTDPIALPAAPSLARAPHPPPRPLTRRRHCGPPQAAATLHHRPSSRLPPSKVKTFKCSSSPPLRFPLFTRAPRCPGRRRFGRPELHRRPPLFKIRPSPSVSPVGEHVPVIPSLSSLRFAPQPSPRPPPPPATGTARTSCTSLSVSNRR
jgi:hypothetical protein